MLLIGAAFGIVNGIAVAYLRMIPFIVTLSTMVLAEGFAIWFTQAQSVYGLPDAFIDTFSARVFSISLPWVERPFGLPVSGLLVLATAVVMGFVLSQTIYGRRVYLTGANEETARISGIKVRRIGVFDLPYRRHHGRHHRDDTDCRPRHRHHCHGPRCAADGHHRRDGDRRSQFEGWQRIHPRHHVRAPVSDHAVERLQPARCLPLHCDGHQGDGAGRGYRARRLEGKMTAKLHMDAVTKTFPGVKALDGVSISARAGEAGWGWSGSTGQGSRHW